MNILHIWTFLHFEHHEPFQENSKESYLSYSLIDNQTDSRWGFNWSEREHILSIYTYIQYSNSAYIKDETIFHFLVNSSVEWKILNMSWLSEKKENANMLNTPFWGYFHFAKFCYFCCLNCILARDSTFCSTGAQTKQTEMQAKQRLTAKKERFLTPVRRAMNKYSTIPNTHTHTPPRPLFRG